MLDGFLIIYNINTISVTKHIQFYGLLKTIETTPRQLNRIMSYRVRNVLLTALPAGLLLGVFITQWIVLVIMGSILEGFSEARLHVVIPLASVFLGDEFIDYNTAHDLALYNNMSRASFSPQEEQSFTPKLME